MMSPSHSLEHDDDEFVPRLSALFAQACLVPLYDRLFEAPDEVARSIQQMRHELDRIEARLVSMASPRAGDGRTGAVNGSHRGEPDGDDDGEEAAPSGPALGRRHRSLVREVALLEILAREERPFALAELLSGVMAHGLADTQGAVVTQLARLKNLGIIDRPADGIYRITDDGLKHLRKQRTRFAGLIE